MFVEMEKIKSQLKDVVETIETSSSSRILEEISNLRARNNSLTDALEKLVKEWVAQKELNRAEFAKVHEEEMKNTQLMSDVQSLMKRMHYNVSSVAKVDIHELKNPIPREASQLEVPKIIRPHQQQKNATSSSQSEPTPVSKEEILRRYETTPIVIADLNIVSPQTQPRKNTSGETVFSENLNLSEKIKWEDSATSSSKRPKIVQRKDSEGKTIMVQEIEKDLDRPLSLVSRDWRGEGLERGAKSIHRALENPIERVIKLDAQATPDIMGGIHEQNKYTLLGKDGNEQRITDGDLADLLHPMDIITLKRINDQDKGNTRFVRRAIDSLSKAGVKLFEKAALSDFDLCINFDYVHKKKVHIPLPDTSIPAEVEEETRTSVIFEQPEHLRLFSETLKKRRLSLELLTSANIQIRLSSI
ncbi:hypothetical protein Hanom_Chr01g00032031 [Helianthus anomalus]